jgi:ABC-type Na+ transport system ATPase subunit NatA
MTEVKLSEETAVQIKINKTIVELEQVHVEAREIDVRVQRLVTEANQSGIAQDSPVGQEYLKRIQGLHRKIEEIKLRELEKLYEIQVLKKCQAEAYAKEYQDRVNAAMAEAKGQKIIGPQKSLILPHLRPMR